MAIADPVLALSFDLAATVRLNQEMNREEEGVRKVYLD
jgi:hypothetical protein